jgi:hypothetical protein
MTLLAHRLDAPVIRGEIPGRPPAITADERELYARIAAAAGGLGPAPAARVDVDLACFGHGDPVLTGASAQLRSVAGCGAFGLWPPFTAGSAGPRHR